MDLRYIQANLGSTDRAGWFKSTRSNPSQNCVEIWVDGPVVRIRDSKNMVGPMLACATASLAALLDSIRRGEL
jgi:hypothetical protein